MMDWQKVQSSHHLQSTYTQCVYACLFVFPVLDYGYVCTGVAQSVGEGTGRHLYQLVNSYLGSPHKHNCTSVCKKGSLWWQCGTVIKEEWVVFVHEHMCLCVILSMGIESRFSATVAYGVHPGDEPVSSTGLFCAHMCGFMGVICVCACVGVCVFCVHASFTLMTICVLLFKAALSAQPHRQMNY